MKRDFHEMLDEARQISDKYGFGTWKVAPYSYWLPVDEMFGWFKDYDNCTRGSKNQMYLELKGLFDTLKEWERQALLPKVKIVCNGKVVEVSSEFAQDLIDNGLAELFEERIG